MKKLILPILMLFSMTAFAEEGACEFLEDNYSGSYSVPRHIAAQIKSRTLDIDFYGCSLYTTVQNFPLKLNFDGTFKIPPLPGEFTGRVQSFDKESGVIQAEAFGETVGQDGEKKVIKVILTARGKRTLSVSINAVLEGGKLKSLLALSGNKR